MTYNSRNPKLIICDVDGTLIDRSEAINKHFDILAGLISENGLHFSIASGRCLDLLQAYIEKLGIDGPVIINNGAGARAGNIPLWDIFMDPFCVKEAVLKADSMDMAIFMCDGDSETAYRHNQYIQREIDVFGRYNRFYIPLEREWPKLKLEKLMITDPEKPGRIDAVLERLHPYKDKLNIVRYDDRHVDIMGRGVAKGKAVRRLADIMNIGLADIMAIGDGDNDIEMIKEAGIGVAVGNAKDILKRHADYVCEGNHTAGVIEAIQKFCL